MKVMLIRSLAFLCLVHLGLMAQTPTLEVPFIEQPPTLDDFVGMQPSAAVQGKMSMVKGFVQRQPRDGQPASNDTHVYMAYDKKHFYAVFMCFDDEPQKLRVNLTPREQVFQDDYVDLQIDTQNDRRRAYTFLSTARGVQWDALWTEGQDFDQSYNALWHSEGRLADRGYMVLMAIPFTTLRFNPGEQTWAILLNRSIPRFAEESFWPRYTINIEGRLNQAATVVGIRDVAPGRDIRLNPYVFARNYKSLDRATATFEKDDFDPEIGLDAKMVILDSFVLDLTANPDFSQVESDEPQVTVNQRYEVFFPERRPFFLENADFFRTLSNLVFTRRITEPSAGLRLTGKKAGWSLGVMAMDDETPGRRVPEDNEHFGDSAEIGIVRINRDILNQSTVGLLHTQWHFGDDHNRVSAIDSRIKFNDNWVGEGQAAHSEDHRHGLDRDGEHYNVMVNRNGRHLNSHSHYQRTDQDFDTRLGFIESDQRPGSQNFHQNLSYFWRPTSSRLVFYSLQGTIGRTWDLEEEMLDRNVELTLSLRTVNNLQFWLEAERTRERLTPREFPYLDHALELDLSNLSLRAEVELSAQFKFFTFLGMGETINFVPATGALPGEADAFQAESSVNWRPISPLQIDFNYILVDLEDPESGAPIFENTIARVKANWQFTREWSFRLISTWDDTDPNEQATSLSRHRNWNSDLLLRYVLNPWTALYLGTNDNQSNYRIVEDESGRSIVRTDGELNNDGRQYFLKFSYLFQF